MAPAKVKFYEPLTLEVDTDFGVAVAGQHFDVRPNTPALDKILADYLKTCYQDYHSLPSKFTVHYPNERTRILVQKDVNGSIKLTQEVLRQYIPGTDKAEAISKYPLLYQQKF